MENPSTIKFPIVAVVAVSAIALGVFLYLTGMAFNPLIISGASFFILLPFRGESILIRRMLVLTVILFCIWVLQDLGITLLPFGFAMLFAYLLDPLVSWLERKKVPRWLAALFIILCMGGGISLVSVFVFPLAFSQLNDVIRQISSLISSTTSYLESRKFYRTLESFGLSQSTMKEMVQNEVMPKIESIYKVMFGALFSVLMSISGLASQLLNIILIPILSFYFVKDFPKIREFIRRMVERKNKGAFVNLLRMSDILKSYIGWQIIAAIMVGTFASILFSIFGVPYPVVLGVLCGFFNPIPLFGSVASMVIAIITVLIINPPGVGGNVITIILVVGGLHFFNAYVVEPRILGKRVGLHPIILLGSLFVFGHFFGFLGLLIAVPTTAILMMFLRDWETKQDSLLSKIADIAEESLS